MSIRWFMDSGLVDPVRSSAFVDNENAAHDIDSKWFCEGYCGRTSARLGNKDIWTRYAAIQGYVFI